MNRSGYFKLFVLALVAHYAVMKVTDMHGDQFIPSLDENSSNERAVATKIQSEFPTLKEEHFLGTDTASKSPVFNTQEGDLGRVEALFEKPNFDEIANDQESHLTDEEILEDLSKLFEEKSAIVQEPVFAKSFDEYLRELGEQIGSFNKDVKKIVSRDVIDEWSKKYPLIVYELESISEDERNSDIMRGSAE
ncbi:hypothetical protein HYV10_02710 [Candidatus Dependentiae bacterium]|nr:hypothetical protein [Candidatus Dependentiae bacterium]